MTGTVLSELDGGVRTITLNRPDKLNAMNDELIADAGEAFREANADAETRAIVFRGAGRAFCAGDDLTAHAKKPSKAKVRAQVNALQAVTHEIVMGDKVVIGAIHGWAVGGGFEWAIDCDLPLWAESARGFFPELKWGMFVTGGVTSILPKIVGLVKAKEMILLGERYSAAQLHNMGVAWRVTADERLFEDAHAVAATIAELPARAAADFKRVINRASSLGVEAAMKLETAAAIRGATDAETLKRVREFGA